MRIGIDATFIGTSKPTGLAVYTWNMVNHLAKIHDDIVLWTSDDYRFELPADKIRLVLKSWSFLGENRYAIRPLWMESFFPRLIRKEKIDVLYSTVQGGMSRCPVPHVVTVTDLVPLIFPEDFPRSVQWNYKYRLPKLLRKAEKIVAISSYTRKDLVDRYHLDGRAIEVIYPAFDSWHYSPQKDEDCLRRYGLQQDKYVLAVGNAYQRKNLEKLIEAFGMVSNSVPHMLALVGPFSEQQKCRLLNVAQQHDVSNRLVLPGYIPYQDLPYVYSGAALFTYLSLYEGFGIPVLEAMSCGTPVLASSTTSVPEVAGDAALLTNPKNTDDIARALARVLQDHNLRESLRSAGSERAAVFTWESASKKVLEVIKSCAQP